MIVFRLCKSKWSDDLSGKGAELTGGRWNSKGIAMVYTSSSRALCMAEVAVHLPLFLVPDDYKLITIEIPDQIKPASLQAEKLKTGWSQFPYTSSTQDLGDQFIKSGNSLILKVPSAIVQDEWNFLINPHHPDIKKVKILKNEPFAFNERLLGKK